MDSPAAGSRLTLVVNPRSGHGRAGRLAVEVSRRLAASNAEVSVQFSTSYADAITRVRDVVQAGDPGDSLVVMGGDGMASIGLNACAGTPVTLGVIPAGTGNDFCRGLGLPGRPLAACAAITSGRIGTVDLLSASGMVEGAGQRYVGSVISTGYDAKVNRAANRAQLQLGQLTYAYVALAELAKFRPLQYRLTIDGRPREVEAMLVAVGNCGYMGGGMRILPRFDATDGLLDITIVHTVGRGTLVRLLPRTFDGGIAKNPAVEMLRAREVVIDGDALFAMADGEELGTVPLTAQVSPGVLSVHLP